MESQDTNAGIGTVRESELLKLIPFSSTHLWREVSIGQFPAPIRIGARAVAWKLSEVRAWIDARPTYTGPSDQSLLIRAKRQEARTARKLVDPVVSGLAARLLSEAVKVSP